ncbi:unnamed protein product [Effrenium voratum]|uniref:Fe2OG dioxygenase domain-containing protein n=1 Tax=Effrenium voratum TaxID=2562239 RepID=A0AA36IN70_9DINO|nr:unnamed protein product [Effrenium voratum]
MEQRLAVGRSASSPNPGSPAQQDARTPQAEQRLLGNAATAAAFGGACAVDVRPDQSHAILQWRSQERLPSFLETHTEELTLSRPGVWGFFQEPWLGRAVVGHVKWPGASWRAKFTVLPSLIAKQEAEAMKEPLIAAPEDFDEDIDGVDRMVTYEFIISSAGAEKAHDPVREPLRQKLRDITEPIIRDRIAPFVRARYPKAGAVCHSMIRRYLENERRSHDTHWDIPSYVSVVVSLDSAGLDFEGGFFVTTGSGEKSFLPLQRGDTVVHQSDLLHGVHVKRGDRWSWAMWFQDSWDCSSRAESWWQLEAEAGDPVAQTLRAMRASTQEESWTWLQSAARQSFPRAQLYLGKAHEDRGATQTAAGWYESARHGGEVDACFYLGLWEQQQGNLSGAAALFQQGAQAGEGKAMAELGKAYRDGQGVPKDPSLARQWLEKAADFTVEAMYLSHLAQASPPEGSAALFLERAARMGHEEAIRKFMEPLAKAKRWEEVMPWLLRLESKAALSQFVKLRKAGVPAQPFAEFRAQRLLADLAHQGFEDARQLLQEMRSAMAPIYQEAPSPMLCKAVALQAGALYASAATLPHASPGMQVTSPMPQPVHAGSPHMVHAAPTPAPAPPTLAAQGTRPRLGVARMVSPMGRAMSTSALHAQVRHFPGAAHAPVQTVPACAWK